MSSAVAKAHGAEIFLQAFAAGLRPSQRLTVSQWADKFRILSGEAAVEPGPYRTSRTPYFREIMDALSPDSPVEEVVCMIASQLGKTEMACNWIGYVVDVCPGPMLVVVPNVELAETFSEQRLRPMLEDSYTIAGEGRRLLDKVAPERSRNAGNRTLRKRMVGGGVLRMVGANAAPGLRAMPVRWLYIDEEDAAKIGISGEGDPIELAKVRARAFGSRSKTLRTSSPTVEGVSRIAKSYAESDQRVYEVPCPFCDTFQVLKWEGLKWEEDKPETAAYECSHCKRSIGEEHKTDMLALGRWVATADSKEPGLRGYHLNALYSPAGQFSWAKAVRQFLRAKRAGPELLRVFFNTVLAETWTERGDAPPWEPLYRRREQYERNTIPRGGVFLTAGVDVQRDRLELEIVAWGRRRESWSIDYRVLEGDTARDEVWEALAEVLHETWPHAGGVDLPLRRVAVDAGFAPSIVGQWVRRWRDPRVMATRGDSRPPVIVSTAQRVEVSSRGKKLRAGLMLWTLGVNHAKQELYGYLRQEPPTDPTAPLPAGFCHFPRDYGEEYFRQLTAEELKLVRTRQGFTRAEWVKLPNRRNEALDCRVYARAAAGACGMDRFEEDDWEALERALGVADAVPKPQTAKRKGEANPEDRPGEDVRAARSERHARAEPPTSQAPRKIRSKWMGRWDKPTR